MYQVSEVLRTIDEHLGVVVVLLLFAWVGGFVQIVEALRLGVRERVAGQPIATTVIMLAHDLTFTFSYQHYVHEIGHPLLVLCWVGMVISNIVEFVLLWHWVRYQRTGLPTGAVWLLLGAFQALAFGVWWWVQSLVDDPLNLVGFTVVQVGATVFGVPMLLGRGTARGQSRVFVWATLLGPGSLGFLFIPYLAPAIGAHWQFWVVVTATTTCALASLLSYEHLRRVDTQRATAITDPPGQKGRIRHTRA